MESTLTARNESSNIARILLITTAMICALIELIDATIVNVALPEIASGIGATRTEVAWVTVSYSIGNIIIIPLSGMLSDWFGRKSYFTTSVILFTFGSLMCGLSGSLWSIILWRCIQGIGGGGLMTTAQSIVIGAFPEDKINTANMIFGLALMVGPILGPMLGGLIVEHLTWHWIFFVNLPIGIVAAVCSLLYVTNLEGSVRPKKIDFLGILFLIIGVGSLEFILEEGGVYDWFSSLTITLLFIVAILGLIAFVIRELTTKHPAVHLRLFKNYNLSMGTFLMFLFGSIMIGSKFFFPLFVRASLGWTAIQTGYILASFAIGTIPGMIFFRKILDKGAPPKIIMLIGLALMSLQLFIFAGSSPSAGISYFLTPFIIGGLGAGALMLPIMTFALSGLRGSDLAQATGLTNLFKRLGSVIGIAVLNVYLDHQTAKVGAGMSHYLSEFNPLTSQRLEGFKHVFVQAGYATDKAMQAAYQMMGNVLGRQQLLVTYDHGYFLMGALLLVVCTPVILLLKNKKKQAIQTLK